MSAASTGSSDRCASIFSGGRERNSSEYWRAIGSWIRNLLLVVAYFAVWIAVRYPAIIENTLHLDDYWIGVSSWSGAVHPPDFCSLPPQDFRWLLMGAICLLSHTCPGWILSVGPKIFAGVSLAFLAFLNFLLLKKWNVPALLAICIPIVWLVHPVINEISLWNTTFLFGACLVLVFLAYLVWDCSKSVSRIVCASGLLTLPLLTYEIYTVCFLVLVLFECVFRNLSRLKCGLRPIMIGVLIFLGASLLYLLQLKFTEEVFGSPVGRGLSAFTISPEYLTEKVHGVLNILVNIFMPIVGYYAGIETAWHSWKWIPIAIAASIFCLAWLGGKSLFERLYLSVFSAFILVLPTFWVLASSQSPQSWRVSVPVLLSASLVFALMLQLLLQVSRTRGAATICSGAAATTLLLTIGAFLAPVSLAEARLRVEENKLDQQLVDHIKSYWRDAEAGGLDYGVGVIRVPALPSSPLRGAARNISKAYGSRGLVSAFQREFSWRGFIAMNGMTAAELESEPSMLFYDEISEGCRLVGNHCRLDLYDLAVSKCLHEPDFVQTETGIRLVKMNQHRLAVVCVAR